MLKRMLVEVNGIVQGVGFRPFIHKLVKDSGLKGWVKNSTTGVTIEVEGNNDILINFVQDIKTKYPKLAVIEKVSYEIFDDIKGYKGFEIIKSTHSEEKFTLISPDVCICEDCLRELFDENDRRYRFPFINCTNCGPRFSIIKDIPYDREKTTMAEFPMCSNCEEEYKDIEDRRYHAQPDCCFECGPELFFIDEFGEKTTNNAIETARNYIKEGKIIAVKGLGGFHLVCDAENSDAVNKLRVRKKRDEKPFAIMCKDISTVEKWCVLNKDERDLLESFRRPIVLLSKKNNLLDHVSMDNKYVGIMLPYTPVHYLLLEKDIDTVVMTSGNVSDLPIIKDNEAAISELKDIADGFLMNNRDIHIRCDDSLMRIYNGKEYPLRRSRGYVPFPIKLNGNMQEILACGAEQKASFALSKDEYVFPSQHIGDLKNIETLEHYENQIRHFEKLFGIVPKKIACDLHPDYMSTNYAIDRGKNSNISVAMIQHHHAHMVSCMADNNIEQKVIGIVWDGTGYGIDDTIWGGEFLVGDAKEFKRYGSIMPIALPGGDKAVKEIYRVGYSLLYDSLGYIPEDFIVSNDVKVIETMIDNKLNTPRASSIGRLFDGVASILDIKHKASYEGQGAVMLESLAIDNDEIYNFSIKKDNGVSVLDWREIIRSIIDDKETGIHKGKIASKFMNTLVEAAIKITKEIRKETNINDIVLSGGVFQNMYLLDRLTKGLIAEGFNVFTHKRVSTNDEGISLGQIVIAANGGEFKCV